MRSVSESNITRAFVECMAEGTDERVRFLLERLAEHLHQFARETKLTHAEWRKAIELLMAAGEISDGERNEFVLFSDVLGLSSLVDMINSPEQGTPSSVLGPFHVAGAPELPAGGDLVRGNEGDVVIVRGSVRAADGQPIEGAEIEIWQTADNGLYSNQDEKQPEYNLRARMKSGKEGRYLFSTIRPSPYTVPDDGPVGELLRATGRHPWRPSHFHFIVTAKGYRQLVTEIFPSDDPYLDEDAVFGVRERLVMELKRKPAEQAGELPDGLEIRGRLASGDGYFTVDFDFVLAEA